MLKHRSPVDPSLELIASYQRSIVQARMDHLRGAAGYTAVELEQERATVEALAARIGDAMRVDYRARSLQP